MGDNEYSDSIEQFKKPVQQNPGLLGSQFGGVDPRSIGMQQQQPQQPQQPQMTQEQFRMYQQQAMQQQQALRQQQLMQQQQMQQQQQQMQQQPDSSSKMDNIKEKFGNMNVSTNFQEILILVILFMIYNNEIVKNLLANIPGINTSGGNYDTLSGIIIAILFAILFIIIRMII